MYVAGGSAVRRQCNVFYTYEENHILYNYNQAKEDYGLCKALITNDDT
jgi:hypothetical protein